MVYITDPCRKCDTKICFSYCEDKQQWLRDKSKGIFTSQNNLPLLKGHVIRRRDRL
jgi:hypothetical protein